MPEVRQSDRMMRLVSGAAEEARSREDGEHAEVAARRHGAHKGTGPAFAAECERVRDVLLVHEDQKLRVLLHEDRLRAG